MQLLYVSWFRKVGNESYHYPHINTRAYSDGEGGEEQSTSGGDVGQREVTFVHGLGGLERRKKGHQMDFKETSGERVNLFFQVNHIYRSFLVFQC